MKRKLATFWLWFTGAPKFRARVWITEGGSSISHLMEFRARDRAMAIEALKNAGVAIDYVDEVL